MLARAPVVSSLRRLQWPLTVSGVSPRLVRAGDAGITTTLTSTSSFPISFLVSSRWYGATGTTSVSTEETAAASLVCPDCGKQFAWESNLTRHRAARHGLVVPSADDALAEAWTKQTEALEKTLTERRARLKAMRRASRKTAAAIVGSAVEGQSGTGSAPHFATAVSVGRASLAVPPEVVAVWQNRGRVLGNNVTRWIGVGVVCGPVEIGTLEGFAPDSAATTACPRVLQFTLQVHGYRERRPAQLRMFRNSVVVRCLLPPSDADRSGRGGESKATQARLHTFSTAFSVQEGDVLRVQGNYVLHSSYDLISKQSVEHVVVEADMVGLLEASTSVTPPSPQALRTPSLSPPGKAITEDRGEAPMTVAVSTTTAQPISAAPARKTKKKRTLVIAKRKKRSS